MKRIPEPELMDDPDQARAYAAADFSEPHQAFIARFGRCFPRHRPRRVLDLGCGAADITIRFARAYPDCELIGVDGAPAMLALARAALEQAGLKSRVTLHEALLPETALPRLAFDTIISNCLLHHLAEPRVLWRAIGEYAQPKAAVFAMDLRRPDTRAQAGRLVEEYAGSEPEVLRRDFLNSLLAAYRPGEIGLQLEQSGLSRLQIEAAGDRHVLVYGHL